jgi:hypothetical protein
MDKEEVVKMIVGRVMGEKEKEEVRKLAREVFERGYHMGWRDSEEVSTRASDL